MGTANAEILKQKYGGQAPLEGFRGVEARADHEARVSKYTGRSSHREQEPGKASGTDNIEYIQCGSE